VILLLLYWLGMFASCLLSWGLLGGKRPCGGSPGVFFFGWGLGGGRCLLLVLFSVSFNLIYNGGRVSVNVAEQFIPSGRCIIVTVYACNFGSALLT
jgi:hypothetical protein